VNNDPTEIILHLQDAAKNIQKIPKPRLFCELDEMYGKVGIFSKNVSCGIALINSSNFGLFVVQ